MAQPNANQDYTPIKTNADRRAEAVSHANDNVKEVLGVEGNWGDHLKHRLSLKTIIKEVLNTITDRIIPQGRNEITNALFSQPGEGAVIGRANSQRQRLSRRRNRGMVSTARPRRTYQR